MYTASVIKKKKKNMLKIFFSIFLYKGCEPNCIKYLSLTIATGPFVSPNSYLNDSLGSIT